MLLELQNAARSKIDINVQEAPQKKKTD